MTSKVKTLMGSTTTDGVRVYTREERRLFLRAHRQCLKQRLTDGVRLVVLGLTLLLPAQSWASAESGDTTPPSAPTNLVAVVMAANSYNRLKLSWTASTDDVAVMDYLPEICSGPSCSSFSALTPTSNIAMTVTNLLTNTSYSFRLRARDTSGNLSGYSNTATGSTAPVPFHPTLNLRRVKQKGAP